MGNNIKSGQLFFHESQEKRMLAGNGWKDGRDVRYQIKDMDTSCGQMNKN